MDLHLHEELFTFGWNRHLGGGKEVFNSHSNKSLIGLMKVVINSNYPSLGLSST
jgi:hypothetical protein